MQDILTTELLSEVLDENISNFSIIENTINYTIENYETEEDGELVYIDLGTNINIYELVHRCKEWAYNQGYSYIGNNKLLNIHSKDNNIISIINPNILNWFDIIIDFIACQWILENKEIK